MVTIARGRFIVSRVCFQPFAISSFHRDNDENFSNRLVKMKFPLYACLEKNLEIAIICFLKLLED